MSFLVLLESSGWEVWNNYTGEVSTLKDKSIEQLSSTTSMLMNILPVIIVLGVLLFIVSVFFGRVDVDGIGHSFTRYWWAIALFGIPLVLIMCFGLNLMLIIGMLIMFTVGGAIFLYLLDNDFELPKGDPVKDGIKWIRKNFRW